ncbi:hypothetical protein QTG54_014142 [Skeletonema marinoi]|uniref:Uncharacterized protein n=1 Tax=Skeletonema marinoi TaxID=267567 RepID=A0AAD8XXE8_9STRA|nr:hypothetical protein QTG54_014142 [Skeletonema marinoi]
MISKSTMMRPLVSSLVLALAMICSNFASVTSFTIPSSANTLSNNHLLGQNSRISTSFSQNHKALKMAADDEERTKSSKIDGSVGGTYFLAAVLLANVWLFTIPTEFRRAHLYPEGNAGLYSDPKGITAKDWAAGVAQYYANGGGVKFDFSVEGKE